MKNFRSGVIQQYDNSGHTATWKFDGSFKLSGGSFDVTPATDRGELPSTVEWIKGDEKPLTFDFDAVVTTADGMFKNAATYVPGDVGGVMSKAGTGKVGTDFVSTTTSDSDVVTYNYRFSDGDHSFTLLDCVVRGAFNEGTTDGNKWAMSGVCPHPFPSSLT